VDDDGDDVDGRGTPSMPAVVLPNVPCALCLHTHSNGPDCWDSLES
jgi:hypothetical protein